MVTKSFVQGITRSGRRSRPVAGNAETRVFGLKQVYPEGSNDANDMKVEWVFH